MAHEKEIFTPEEQAAAIIVEALNKPVTLATLYEARLLHQAETLDVIFRRLVERSGRENRIDTLAMCYGAAFKAQKLCTDSTEILMRLEQAREKKMTEKATEKAKNKSANELDKPV